MSMKIYCDMDGVLVDFSGPALQLINNSIEEYDIQPEKVKKLIDKATIATKRNNIILENIKIQPKGNKHARNLLFHTISNSIEFWAMLPWTPNGKMLWNFIKDYNPIILTNPPDKSAMKGKKIWIYNNLNISYDNIIFEKNKEKYAKKNTILIDDFITNIEPFQKSGGNGILYNGYNKNTEKTIKILRTFLK